MTPIRHPLAAEEIERDVSKLLENGSHEILTQGRYRILAFIRDEAPALFHELARQREIAFRDSGQGSGTDFDETPEDLHYTQLILWDQEAGRIAGAYRIGFTAEVLPRDGIDGLYLSHMFDFEPEFFGKIGPAMELSRSFVTPDYQGDRLALALLWRALGQTLVADGSRHSLFGSVTISANFSSASRSLLIAWLARHRSDPDKSLAKARVPFAPDMEHLSGINLDHHAESIDSLRDRITDRDGQALPIPPLIRHYLTLGARFHAFHREASFGDAIYCLLDVGIDSMPPAHRRRFLGYV